MSSRPSSSSRNSIGFPSTPRPRRAPFHARNNDVPATPGSDTTSFPEADSPLSLCAALDRHADASGDAEASISPDDDSLEHRIATRLGETGGDSSQHSPDPGAPEILGTAQDPTVSYDPELIDILEQLNQTLDSAHAALDEGGAAAPGIAQPMADIPLLNGFLPPRRRMIIMAAAVGLVLATAGLIYANPWTTDRSPPAGAASDGSAASEEPAEPRPAAPRTGTSAPAPATALASKPDAFGGAPIEAPTPESAAAPPTRRTAAPPTTAAQAAAIAPSAAAERITGEDEARLLERGKTLMRDGDIAGARLIFEHAAERGSVGAMAALARAYDPDHLSKLDIQGIRPDPDKAISWYERASRSGDRQSRVRAEALLPQARR